MATADFGVTQVVTLDQDALVLATRAFVDSWASGLASSANPASKAGVTVDFTHLHLFDLKGDPRTVRYVASGKVPGTVNAPFALDERSGDLRVATTEQRSVTYSDRGVSSACPASVSHAYVLRAAGAGDDASLMAPRDHQGGLGGSQRPSRQAPEWQLWILRRFASSACR